MKRYNKLFEQKNWITIQKLKENIRLSDLKNNQGMSALSTKFKKERNKIMGSETAVTKLIDCIIQGDGKIDFVFKAQSTDKYPPDFTHKKALIKLDYDLRNNPEKVYTITIRILEVFDWISTYSLEDEITAKDIKDILDVSTIELDSTVPAYFFQGGAYYLQQFDGTIYKKPIIAPSDKKNKNGKMIGWKSRHGAGDFLIDKITQSVINQISFYRNLMASMLTKQLKKKGLI